MGMFCSVIQYDGVTAERWKGPPERCSGSGHLIISLVGCGFLMFIWTPPLPVGHLVVDQARESVFCLCTKGASFEETEIQWCLLYSTYIHVHGMTFHYGWYCGHKTYLNTLRFTLETFIILFWNEFYNISYIVAI